MRVFEVKCSVGIAYRNGEYAAAPFKFVGNHAWASNVSCDR
jgi:hypothetical protein